MLCEKTEEIYLLHESIPDNGMFRTMKNPRRKKSKTGLKTLNCYNTLQTTGCWYCKPEAQPH